MFICQNCGKNEYDMWKENVLDNGYIIYVCNECKHTKYTNSGNDNMKIAKPMKEIIDEMIIPIPVKTTPIKADTEQLIMETCESVAAMLTDKNEKYGDSALNPLNIFSKVPPGESLVARIDDKLARIKNNDELLRDDIMDITGYLILLLIENDWTGYNGEEKV